MHAEELSDAARALDDLLRDEAAQQQNRNEAETRFHLIDRLIESVFGWERSSFKLEKPLGRTYTDYELDTPTRAIWEAKREGKTFELPVRSRSGFVHDLSSIMLSSEAARDAIVQVNQYCLDRGVDVAVATNGHQIIAFIPKAQNSSGSIQGKSVVISSLEGLRAHLSRMWQFLSPDGLRQGTLISFLTRMALPTPPKRLSALVPDYPQFIQPTPLQQSLANMAHLLLISIETQEDIEKQFYKECYCESGALSQHALLSKQMLNARYAALFPVDAESPRIEPAIAKPGKPLLTPDVLSDAISNRPIVLLGDVGVGKSSFMKHLMYVSAYDEFQHAMYVYIDLGRTGALSTNLQSVVLDQIEEVLLSAYSIDIFEGQFIRAVYKKDVKRFERGLFANWKDERPSEYEQKLIEMLAQKQSDRAAHTRAAINYLASEKRKQVIFAIDNADQRDAGVQEEAFIIAQNLAAEWKATVFVSMRPRTFYQSKRSGALSAYPHRVFTIAPPRIDAVVEKRIRFAIDVAEGRRQLDILQQIRLNLSNIAAFLNVILNTVRRNDEVNIFLENITGGNIRLLVELVANTIGSPNIDTEGVVRSLGHEGNYILPVHEWWKVAMKGDFHYFDPAKVVTSNIFEIFGNDRREHFLLPILLSYLDTNGRHRNGEGLVSYIDMASEMQAWGFKLSSIESAVRFANNRRLIDSSNRVTFDEDEAGLHGDIPGLWRINTVGAYHLRVWAASFSYLDAIAIDLAIYDRELSDTLAENIRSLALADRLDRATLVQAYLGDVWRDFGSSPEYFDWFTQCDESQSTFEPVRRALNRLQQAHHVA